LLPTAMAAEGASPARVRPRTTATRKLESARRGELRTRFIEAGIPVGCPDTGHHSLARTVSPFLERAAVTGQAVGACRIWWVREAADPLGIKKHTQPRGAQQADRRTRGDGSGVRSRPLLREHVV